jgi:Sulphur transport
MTWSLLVFSVAFLLAALMGYAIQRGATCTVAAVDEWMTTGRATRLAGMVESSLWVAGGLLVAKHAGWLGQVPHGYAVGMATVSGAFLLGWGAYINRACVFGTVARLSGGDWAYAFTPVGFYLGCKAFIELPHAMTPQALPAGSVWFDVTPAWAWLVLALMCIRLSVALVRAHQIQPFMGRATVAQLGARLWAPQPATVVIGVAFLLLWLLAGSWAYTDVLAEWARTMAGADGARAALAAALFGGALWAGRSSSRWRSRPPQMAALLRCTVGGFFMGWGSQWIPGGNDGLILMGMPLLWPYAWVGFLVMFATIAALMRTQRFIGSRTPV